MEALNLASHINGKHKFGVFVNRVLGEYLDLREGRKPNKCVNIKA
jgi:hypothetical protein